MGYADELWEIASSHHGVFTSSDAEDAGVPGVELRKMTARGTLERVARGVYRHPRVQVDRFTEAAGAVAAMGPGAYLEWDTVLSLHDLASVEPSFIHVGLTRSTTRSVPGRVRVSRRSTRAGAGPSVEGLGLAVHPLSEQDISHVEGVPALSVHRALLDAMGRIPTDRLDVALDDAMSHGLLDRREHAHVNWVLVNVNDGLVTLPFQHIEGTAPSLLDSF
ncbi:MAG: type IV toxin-antitoxin system AbiEi family antitoxin domain-containing protein [Luteococcus sp.]|uniref:type IV toxin-antitoxin system AbiEi family antitoxin domain-containing protein n=1 Tax=Luteococcus sp. TaxID=1969402 RepID=UPI00264998E1|nr:type IV toxin-antitoxin system AbiEi family antitoxin domain-containing protein [Luteococcus sp.]MDN5565001.1 type IV toxin-antitoxin system AbiEi family antitoxin domain-containing protein [Luteococcus sp.]